MPRLSIGLPVYNGEEYLAEALDALLDQTFGDFELIVSDNASTDRTAAICRRYAARDARIRYVRQTRNIGATGNHNATTEMAGSPLFKWASHDDCYAPDLLERCVAALDAHPGTIAAHAWTAKIDGDGAILDRYRYPLATASPHAPERFRSALFDVGGDDAYAVFRTDVLRRVLPYGSFYRADRVLIGSLTLHGPFHQVPDWLYYRRDQPDRATRAPSVRAWCTTMDPRRADRLRHPVPRLLAEYVLGYLRQIHRAPLSAADRRACYLLVGEWLGSRARPRRLHRGAEPEPEIHAGPTGERVEGRQA
ncbi:glycosyltransferase family 2 protein [Pseudonocardia pini]|uniref:glycosyltransferase family 2 protein n=1 Tax=Pseudonocardia pini TaxID=2758030 RepID=UPI0015F10A56|nr:glycosyltransferase family 2 protein [Pseudonocardia pini]